MRASRRGGTEAAALKSWRNALLGLMPPHGAAEVPWPKSAQPVAVGVARNMQHPRRAPGALVHLPLVAHAEGLCAENKEIGRKAVTEEAARFVRGQGRTDDALPGRNAAGPSRRVKAANQAWCGQRGTMSTTRAPYRSMMSKIAWS